MQRDYSDILKRVGAPLWWDDAGAPRYVRFHPRHCGVYADEVWYELRACQACGWSYKQATSEDVRIGDDPPRHRPSGKGHRPRYECVGTTMTSELVRSISHWTQRDAAGKLASWRKQSPA
jgi:hypothetical protein